MSSQFTSVDKAMRHARTLARKGKLTEAQEVYAAVLERFPGNKRATEGLNALLKSKPAGRGLTREQAERVAALHRSGQLDRALAETQALAAAHPSVPFLHNLLGAIHLDLGKPGEAETHFRNAIALRPTDPQAHGNLGNALKALGRHEDAIASMREALRLDPDQAYLHNNIANALGESGQAEEAIDHLETALELRPDFAEAHSNLGNLLLATGQPDDAAEHYETALEIDPAQTAIHHNLSTIKTFEPDDPQIARMEKLLDGQASDRQAKVKLNFALGKAYDDIGEPDAAFEHLAEANRLRRAELTYRPKRDEALFERIKTTFEAVARATPAAVPSDGDAPAPIFVVGMPRSGTSLIEQILASHPEVHGAGELPFMERIAMPLLRGETDPAEAIAEIRRNYLPAIADLDADAPYVVDKMPLNFRWIGFILLAIPEARIVHVNRDAVATGWSIFKHYFPSRDLGFAFDLDDIARYMTLRDDLMDFWRDRFGDRILDFDYDALTENQEEETARLLAHCELDWDESCLAFHRTERTVRTASAAQVRQKLYRGSSAAWKRYADRLGPLLKAA